MIIKKKDIHIITNPHTTAISHIVKNGKNIKYNGFKIKYCKIDDEFCDANLKFITPNCNFCIFCVIISKKVAKSAVVRNYYKRYFRNEFIKICNKSIQKRGICIVINDIKEIQKNIFNKEFLEIII